MLATAACGAPESASIIVRDSGGVRIVENLSPARATALEIDPTPLADIGGLEAPHANRLAPAFDDLAANRDGGFWLWRTPAPRVVSVIDSSGRWLGDATLPEGLRPVELGPDWVLGTWTDGDGIVHVRLHRFRAARDA